MNYYIWSVDWNHLFIYSALPACSKLILVPIGVNLGFLRDRVP